MIGKMQRRARRMRAAGKTEQEIFTATHPITPELALKLAQKSKTEAKQ